MKETDGDTVLLNFSEIADSARTGKDDKMISYNNDAGQRVTIFRRAPDRDAGYAAGNPRNTRDAGKEKDQLQNEQGLAFLAAAKKGDAAELRLLLNNGAPANFVDPVDHATALHYAAAYAARPALGVILSNGRCDSFSATGREGCPLEIAREYGRDR